MSRAVSFLRNRIFFRDEDGFPSDAVRIGAAGHKGLGLFAARAFAPGEVVYDIPEALVWPTTRFYFRLREAPYIPVGRRVFGPVDPIDLDEAVLDDALATFALDPSGSWGERRDRLWDHLSSGGAKRHVSSFFDDLINHASAPNTVHADRPHRAGVVSGVPVLFFRRTAAGPIQAGDELTTDYRSFGAEPDPAWEPEAPSSATCAENAS